MIHPSIGEKANKKTSKARNIETNKNTHTTKQINEHIIIGGIYKQRIDMAIEREEKNSNNKTFRKKQHLTNQCLHFKKKQIDLERPF